MAKKNPPNYFGYKTRQEMAREYNLSPKPFMKKLARAGITLPPGRVSPKDQKRIYETIGYPPKCL